MEVVNLRTLPQDKVEGIVNDIANRLGKKDNAGNIVEPLEVPPNIFRYLRGMTAHSIQQAIIQSIVRTKKEDDPTKKNRILPEYLLEYRRRQLQKTDLLSYIDTTQFSFGSIGGLDRIKTWANKVKGAWTEEGEKFGLKIPRGILVVGVYGCGKSTLVKSLGSAWGVPVVTMSMSRLRGGLVGESEGNLRRALNIIESVSPCIVFIDEAEKEFAGSNSGQNDAGVGARMLAMFSSWVQDSKAKVCFAMTANSLEGFPPEVLNRLDDRFFVDLPSQEDRVDILKIHLKNFGQDPAKFQLAKLSNAAHLMVGREIEQAVGAAMVESFHQKKEGLDETVLLSELKRKPRIVNTMKDEIDKILNWVGYDPERDEGVRARFASDANADRFKVVASK
jgi:SpoVK/Ycf46/Vps4 family AAA+-type ATPase